MKLNWGTSIAIVYVVFMIGMISVVVVAVRKGVNLVRPDYYQEGVSYQHNIDAQANLLRLEKKVELRNEAAELVIKLPTPEPAKGTVHMFRPSDFKLDKTFTFEVGVDEKIHIPTTDLIRGDWVTKIKWKGADKSYEYQRDVKLK